MTRCNSSAHLVYAYPSLHDPCSRKIGDPIATSERKRNDHITSRNLATFLHFQLSTYITQSLFECSCLMRVLVETHIQHVSHLKPIILKMKIEPTIPIDSLSPPGITFGVNLSLPILETKISTIQFRFLSYMKS